jgi:hypothetical protein
MCELIDAKNQKLPPDLLSLTNRVGIMLTETSATHEKIADVLR